MVTTFEGVVGDRVEETDSQCRHHWLLEPAGGPTSKGVCRICGAQREFKNRLEGTEWNEDPPARPDPVHALVSSAGLADESEEES